MVLQNVQGSAGRQAGTWLTAKESVQYAGKSRSNTKDQVKEPKKHMDKLTEGDMIELLMRFTSSRCLDGLENSGERNDVSTKGSAGIQNGRSLEKSGDI